MHGRRARELKALATEVLKMLVKVGRKLIQQRYVTQKAKRNIKGLEVYINSRTKDHGT